MHKKVRICTHPSNFYTHLGEWASANFQAWCEKAGHLIVSLVMSSCLIEKCNIYAKVVKQDKTFQEYLNQCDWVDGTKNKDQNASKLWLKA